MLSKAYSGAAVFVSLSLVWLLLPSHQQVRAQRQLNEMPRHFQAKSGCNECKYGNRHELKQPNIRRSAAYLERDIHRR
ncbi:hypothetical protein V8C35DRAFT_318191 [Trichoderma chlorosporum]